MADLYLRSNSDKANILSLRSQEDKVLKNYELELDIGTYEVTGASVDFIVGSSIDIEIGTFSVTGTNIDFIYAGEVTSQIITVSGTVVFGVTSTDNSIVMLEDQVSFNVEVKE